ncbi:hypothetical protein CSUI_005714 [Cystoisospora suis]|uniref:Uncharacterized protein n=1 Tax=Cystoisospora suis TaxID=483139 RepID=A0A2C6KWZ2_9APIC|nr:hypothetical protein CSUI_005714 [Cystoisospora suis]
MQDEDQKKLEMNEKQQIRRRREHKEEAKEECEIPTNSRDTDGPFSDHRRRNCMSLNEQIGVLDDKREGKDSTQPSREVLPSRHCRYEETRMKDGKGVRERSDGRLESEMSRLGRVDTDQRGGSTTHRTLCRENKRKDKRNHVSSETENEDKKEKAKEEECCKKKKSIEFAGNRALTRTSSFPGKDSKTATNGDSTSKTSKNQSGALSEREEFFFNPSWSESGSDVKRQTMLASPGEMRPRDDENTKEQQKSEEGRRRNERACGIQKESVLEDSSPNITGGEGTMKADSKAVKNSGDREERQHDAPDQKRQHSSHVVQPESDVKKKEKRFLKSTRVSFYRISSAPSDLSFKPEESPALPSHPSQTNSTLTSTRFWGDHEEERRDTSKCKDLRECLSPLLSQLRGRPPSTKEQQLSRRGIGGEEKGLGLSSRCFSHSDNLMNAIIEEERENEEEECDNEREPDGAYNNYCAAVPVNRTVSDRGPCSVRFLGKEKSSSDDEDEVFLLRFPSWSSRSRRARHERSSRMLPALWSKPWGVGDGGGEKFARFSSGSSPGTILSIERQTAIFKSSRPCAESLFQKRLLALSEDRRRRIIHEPHCQRGNRSCLSSGTAGKENGKTTTIEECQANGVDDDDDRRDRQRTHSTEKQEDRVYSAEEVVRNRTPSGEGNISYSTDGVQPLLSKLKVTGESSDGPPAVGSTCGGGVCVRKNEAVKRVGPVCSSIKKTEQSIEVQSYVKKAATHEQGEEWKNEAAAAKEFSPSSNKDTAAHGEKNVGEAVKSLKERTLVRRRNSWLNAAGGEGHVSTMSSPVARRPVGSHHGEYLSSLSSGKDSRHNIKKDVGGSPLCRGTNDSNRSTGKQPFAEDRWWMRSDKQKDKSKIVTRRGSLPGGSLLSMGSRSLFEGNGDARDPRVPPPYHSVQQAEAKVTNFLLKRRDDDTKIEDGATTEKGSSGTEPKPLDAKVRIGDVGRGHRVLKWAEKTKRAEAGDQTDEPAACLPPSLPGKPPVPHGSKLKEKPCSTPRKGDIEQGTLVQQGDGGDDNSQQEKFEGAPVGVCIARDSTTTARGVFWAEASEILVAGERTKVVYSDTKVPPGSFLRGRCDASVKSSAITSNSSQVAVQSDVTRYSSTVGEAQLTTEEVKHSQEQKDPRSDSSYYVDETEHDFKFHSGEMDDLPLPPLRRTDDIKVQTQHKLEVLESLKKGGSSGIIQHRFGDTCSAYLSKYQCTREKSSVQYELPSPLQHDAPQFEIWAEEATTDGTATRGKGSRGRVASSEGTGSRETTALSDALKYVKAEKKIEGPPSLGTPESETGQKHLTPVGHTQISILKKQHSTRGVDGLPLRSGEVSAHQAVPVLDQAARTSSSREGDRGESSTICSGGAGDVRNTLSCMDGPRSGGDTCASNAKPLTGTRSYLSHKGFAEASSTSPHKTGCFFPSEEHHHSHLYASRPRASSLLQGAEPSPYHGCNGRPRHHRGGVGCAGEYAVSQGTLNAKRSSSYGEVTCGENSLVQPVTRSMSLHW